jgi:PAS domain S-box-containing protein
MDPLLARLSASIAVSPIAFAVADARGTDRPLLAVNQAFCALTLYAEAEALGRNARFLQGPDTDPLAIARIRANLNAGRTTLTEILNYRSDGSTFRNSMMIAPVLDDSGALVYFLGSQVDLAGVVGDGRRARATGLVATLSPRQAEVLRAIAAGASNKHIAHQLGLSPKTIEMHRSLLLAKLGVATAAEAIRIAIEAGL